MIRFENVSKKYAGTKRPAIDSMELEVARGEFVFLVGASGSGKSTCLRLILKEEKPSRGKIHVLGNDLGTISSRKIPYFRRNLGVVFQDFRLLPNKTVFQNVAFSLQVIGKSRGFVQEAVPDVLTMVGLEGKAERLPHELSGGEQQRVAIARAVVNKPQILLADEPTGNLDPATSAGIMQLLERINAGGTTVLMATHEAGIVDKMQRRVIELVGGNIVRDEREGGYGDTGIVPELGPAQQRGQSAKRAREDIAAATAEADAHTQAIRLGGPAAPVASPAATTSPAHAPEPRSFADAPDAPGESAAASTPTQDAPVAESTGPISIPRTQAHDDALGHLSLAERLGLRSPEKSGDDQNIGPVK